MTQVVGRFDALRMWFSRNSWIVIPVGLTIAIYYPFAVPRYYLSLAIEILIYSIFAMSLDLLLGYTGLTSFGHAAFFGLGAYIVAYISSTNDRALNLTDNLLVTLPFAVAGCALAAAIIGFFALRTRGIYFLMVTLAFAQMLFSVAISFSRVTGGSDGLAGVPRPSFGIASFKYAIDTPQSFYFLCLIACVATWFLLWRIVNSPFGWALRGIRENEPRLRALGYNTFRYKMAAFVIAGAFAGIAGGLVSQYLFIASPDNLYWTTSGLVMVMLIVGGTGTLSGPILGATAVRLIRNLLSSRIAGIEFVADRWETALGLVFILFVLFAPRGIVGLLQAIRLNRRPE